eukprot:XP_012812948.1 PREDICTED: mucin-5AC-like [Xenopus tropicalis]
MEVAKFILMIGMCFSKFSISTAACAGLRQLQNGRTFFRYGGIYATFVCDAGFSLMGPTSSSCVRGHWRKPVPVCVASGCQPVGGLINGRLVISFSGAVITFMCNKGYKLSGSSVIYCDGRKWNSTKPVCREYDMMSTKEKTLFPNEKFIVEDISNQRKPTGHTSSTEQNVTWHRTHHIIPKDRQNSRQLTTISANVVNTDQELVNGSKKKTLLHSLVTSLSTTKEIGSVTNAHKVYGDESAAFQPAMRQISTVSVIPRWSKSSATNIATPRLRSKSHFSGTNYAETNHHNLRVQNNSDMFGPSSSSPYEAHTARTFIKLYTEFTSAPTPDSTPETTQSLQSRFISSDNKAVNNDRIQAKINASPSNSSYMHLLNKIIMTKIPEITPNTSTLEQRKNFPTSSPSSYTNASSSSITDKNLPDEGNFPTSGYEQVLTTAQVLSPSHLLKNSSNMFGLSSSLLYEAHTKKTIINSDIEFISLDSAPKTTQSLKSSSDVSSGGLMLKDNSSPLLLSPYEAHTTRSFINSDTALTSITTPDSATTTTQSLQSRFINSVRMVNSDDRIQTKKNTSLSNILNMHFLNKIIAIIPEITANTSTFEQRNIFGPTGSPSSNSTSSSSIKGENLPDQGNFSTSEYKTVTTTAQAQALSPSHFHSSAVSSDGLMLKNNSDMFDPLSLSPYEAHTIRTFINSATALTLTTTPDSITGTTQSLQSRFVSLNVSKMVNGDDRSQTMINATQAKSTSSSSIKDKILPDEGNFLTNGYLPVLTTAQAQALSASHFHSSAVSSDGLMLQSNSNMFGLLALSPYEASSTRAIINSDTAFISPDSAHKTTQSLKSRFMSSGVDKMVYNYRSQTKINSTASNIFYMNFLNKIAMTKVPKMTSSLEQRNILGPTSSPSSNNTSSSSSSIKHKNLPEEGKFPTSGYEPVLTTAQAQALPATHFHSSSVSSDRIVLKNHSDMFGPPSLSPYKEHTTRTFINSDTEFTLTTMPDSAPETTQSLQSRFTSSDVSKMVSDDRSQTKINASTSDISYMHFLNKIIMTEIPKSSPSDGLMLKSNSNMFDPSSSSPPYEPHTTRSFINSDGELTSATTPASAPETTQSLHLRYTSSNVNKMTTDDKSQTIMNTTQSNISYMHFSNKTTLTEKPEITASTSALEERHILGLTSSPLSYESASSHLIKNKNLPDKGYFSTSKYEAVLTTGHAKALSATHFHFSGASSGLMQGKAKETSNKKLAATRSSDVGNLGVITLRQNLLKETSNSSASQDNLFNPTTEMQSTLLEKPENVQTYRTETESKAPKVATTPVKVIDYLHSGSKRKYFRRRSYCTYPPVPTHGTFRFLTMIDPSPYQYQYYIQYSCYPGYTMSQGDVFSFCLENGKWTGVTPVCEEPVPCSVDNGGCSQICKSHGEGQAECACKMGFQLLSDMRTCRDIDECSSEMRLCEHDCTNTFGSYQCSCWKGFTLTEGGRTCIPYT